MRRHPFQQRKVYTVKSTPSEDSAASNISENREAIRQRNAPRMKQCSSAIHQIQCILVAQHGSEKSYQLNTKRRRRIQVNISDAGFSPSTVSIKQGQTIRFCNKLPANSSPLRLQGLSKEHLLLDYSKSLECRFDNHGKYTLYCSPGPDLTCTIEVGSSPLNKENKAVATYRAIIPSVTELRMLAMKSSPLRDISSSSFNVCSLHKNKAEGTVQSSAQQHQELGKAPPSADLEKPPTSDTTGVFKAEELSFEEYLKVKMRQAISLKKLMDCPKLSFSRRDERTCRLAKNFLQTSTLTYIID